MNLAWSQIAIDWMQLCLLALAVGFLLHEVGIVWLGQAAMAMVGGYAFGIAAMSDTPGILATFHAIIGLVLTLVLMTLVILRVSADTLALVTLALAQILQLIAIAALEQTGGPLGLGPIPRPALLAEESGAMLMSALILSLVALIYFLVARSRIGLLLGLTRDMEIAARAFGIRTRLLLLAAMGSAAFVAAVGGVSYAITFGLVTPAYGNLTVSLQALSCAILARPFWRQGRPQYVLAGYAVMSLLLVIIPPMLRQMSFDSQIADAARQALMGAALFVMVHPAFSRWTGWRRTERPG